MSQRYDVDQYGYCPDHGRPVPNNAPCPGCVADAPAIVPARRLNVGCGEWPLLYWVNLDASPNVHADIHQQVPPLPFEDGSLDEIYAGHCLEHLSQADAKAFLIECQRCLVPGGKLGIVVPDTREIMARYLRGDIDAVEFPAGVYRPIADLDQVCELFLYSTAQESPHQWSYDLATLKRLLEAHGFIVERQIDRYRDPRIPVGAWYQCGWDAHKPEAA